MNRCMGPRSSPNPLWILKVLSLLLSLKLISVLKNQCFSSNFTLFGILALFKYVFTIFDHDGGLLVSDCFYFLAVSFMIIFMLSNVGDDLFSTFS